MLLSIIYLAFIGLGLPDAVLGAAWPVMYQELEAPLAGAGVVSAIICGAPILSSLWSARLIRRLGTAAVTVFSVAVTAVALWGFSTCNTFWELCLWAVPYGLGAGCVDAALNNYVAVRYEARHMNWLHCFWGVGAMVGPYLMGWCLTGGYRWNRGYQGLALLQVIVTAALLASLPLWSRGTGPESTAASTSRKPLFALLALPGAKQVMASFFCQCSLEQIAALWGGTFLVEARGVDAGLAARWSALVFLGVTAGRFLSGFLALRLTDRQLVRLGQGTMAVGALLLLLAPSGRLLAVGLVVLGLGAGPVYPCLTHATPAHFGVENSQEMMGLQMACAYVGSTLTPWVVGLAAEQVDAGIFPVVLLVLVAGMTLLTERKNRLLPEVR